MSLYRKMCNLTCKKACLIVVLITFFLLFTIYSLFFHHGPPEDIMAANRQGDRVKVMKKSDESLDDLEQELEAELTQAAEKWEKFIKDNNYVSIGEIYDNCDEQERLMVGKTIMLPDKRWGGISGVKSRTFINATLDSEVMGGRFYLSVKYNGNDLYNRNWELCTLDQDYDDRIIYCPFNPGDYHFKKDRQIPLYLPKGRYETKGWITNQDDETILCGFADFTL